MCRPKKSHYEEEGQGTLLTDGIIRGVNHLGLSAVEPGKFPVQRSSADRTTHPEVPERGPVSAFVLVEAGITGMSYEAGSRRIRPWRALQGQDFRPSPHCNVFL